MSHKLKISGHHQVLPGTLQVSLNVCPNLMVAGKTVTDYCLEFVIGNPEQYSEWNYLRRHSSSYNWCTSKSLVHTLPFYRTTCYSICQSIHSRIYQFELILHL